MERENLAGDAKGKGTSGSNREAESTDAPERGGLPRSSSPPALPTHSEWNAPKSLPRRRNRAAAESLFLCSVEAG